MHPGLLRLQRLRRRLREPIDASLLDDLERVLVEAIERLRRLMFDLAPPILEQEGIGAALRLYLVEVFDSLNMPWTLVDNITEEPGPLIKALAYRLTKELLSNALKHSKATRVVVTVSNAEGGVAVTVSDDGVGFDATSPRAASPGHLGLDGFATMVAAATGWANIRSAPGTGTTGELWLPDIAG